MTCPSGSFPSAHTHAETVPIILQKKKREAFCGYMCASHQSPPSLCKPGGQPLPAASMFSLPILPQRRSSKIPSPPHPGATQAATEPDPRGCSLVSSHSTFTQNSTWLVTLIFLKHCVTCLCFSSP